jgi:hypothetical protein
VALIIESDDALGSFVVNGTTTPRLAEGIKKSVESVGSQEPTFAHEVA